MMLSLQFGSGEAGGADATEIERVVDILQKLIFLE